MTNRMRGIKFMPGIAGLGLLLLLGAFVLVLQNPAGNAGAGPGAAAAAKTQVNALLTAQSAILAARQVMSDGSPDAVRALSDAARSLGAVEQQGLTPEDTSAIERLLTSIETIQNGRTANQALATARAELDGLLPELEDLSSVLEQAIVVQSPAVVAAHLDRLRLLGESMRRDVQESGNG